MLLFIGVFPYCIKTWWNKLLYQPLVHGNTKPLFDILARVMWRTEKEDVLDQVKQIDGCLFVQILLYYVIHVPCSYFETLIALMKSC